MKSSRTLFLFTKTYPFGTAEQYIQNEIVYLAERFEKVIIYQNDYYKVVDKDALTRLPENAEVLNFNMQLDPRSKSGLSDYLYLLRTGLAELWGNTDKKYLINHFRYNLVNFWTQVQIARQLGEYLDKCGYNSSNAVFYSYWFHKSALLLGILKDRKYISKFVSRAHSVDLYHNDWGIIDRVTMVPPFKMFKIKQVDQLYPVSQHGANYLKSRLTQYAKKIKCSYLGVPGPLKPNIKEISGSFHVVTCSHLVPNKRMHVLARALGKLEGKVKWTHFGDGSMRNQVEEIVKSFSANITAELKGNVSNKEILSFYIDKEIDLFVNLSIVEGLPVSIMEAMASGLPILATAIYGTPEAVEHGVNGFLLSKDFSPEQLVQQLDFCMKNRLRLKDMGTESRRIWNERFNAEKNYTHFASELAQN